jgi:hypothetical protein
LAWRWDGWPTARRRSSARLLVAGVSVQKLDLPFRHRASNPLWWSSTAFVNDDLMAKCAWSEIGPACSTEKACCYDASLVGPPVFDCPRLLP